MSASPVKVDQETHALIAHAATALRVSQKDLLAAAVREYLGAHREEIRAALRRTMEALDGTNASRVAALSGLSRERLDELGGVREP
jgi:type IV pilus biogenesis protein CpaD/CtpE